MKVIILTLLLFLIFSTIFYAQAPSEELSCTASDCHGNIMLLENIHPILEDGCESCHEANENSHPSAAGNEFTLTAEIPELCFGCHDEPEESMTIHAPFADGDCLTCHSPHSTKQETLLVYENNNICSDCHDLENESNPVIHSPVEKNQCRGCHTHHYSANKTLLIKQEPKFCFDCHTRHKEQLSMVSVHPVFSDGCSDCHQPHNSNNHSLLTSAYPRQNYSSWNAQPYSLCFECHDQEVFENPATNDATEFRNGDVNLHYLHVNKEKGRTCYNCHTIHGSNNPHLITPTIQFGKWNMPLFYSQNEEGGTCITACHKELTYKR